MKLFENVGELSHFLAYEALQYLAKNGPSMSAKEVYSYIIDFARKNLELPPELHETYNESETNPKYVVAMDFKLVGYAKAGWLKKSSPKRGYWTITDEGIQIAKSGKPLSEVKQLVHEKYWQWKNDHDTVSSKAEKEAEEDGQLAQKTIRDKILTLDPYEFRDLTAGLLEGMGYFIDFNAPRGKDGGVDLVCYRDPLGAEIPRMKVQCKHTPDSKISRAHVSQFAGVINNNDEIGIFVTTGFFTNDAKQYAMGRNEHIRLIDGQELEDMWAKYYSHIPEDKKALLPIKFTAELLEEAT